MRDDPDPPAALDVRDEYASAPVGPRSRAWLASRRVAVMAGKRPYGRDRKRGETGWKAVPVTRHRMTTRMIRA